MNKLFTGLSCILISTTLLSCQNENNTFTSITMDEALKRFEKESDYVIVDVRRKDEYESGHIPNAINIANETIENEATDILKDKAQRIYVYCRSGVRSKQASEKLVKMGYTNIVEFGGILDYKGELEY